MRDWWGDCVRSGPTVSVGESIPTGFYFQNANPPWVWFADLTSGFRGARVLHQTKSETLNINMLQQADRCAGLCFTLMCMKLAFQCCRILSALFLIC